MKKIIELVIYEDDSPGYKMKFKYRDFKIQGNKQTKDKPFWWAKKTLEMAEKSMPFDLVRENKDKE